MQEIKTHYCYEVGSHEDNCQCDCVLCIKRGEDIKREIFNKKLSEAIKKRGL